MQPCVAGLWLLDYYVQGRCVGELVSLLESNQPPDTAVWAVYPQRRYPLPVRLGRALKTGLAKRSEYAGTGDQALNRASDASNDAEPP